MIPLFSATSFEHIPLNAEIVSRGVEKLSNGYDNSPATQKQHSLICDLLKAYPPAWEYPEFEKYRVEQSKGAATECINAFIEHFISEIGIL